MAGVWKVLGPFVTFAFGLSGCLLIYAILLRVKVGGSMHLREEVGNDVWPSRDCGLVLAQASLSRSSIVCDLGEVGQLSID
eukprot:4434060-Amphidinium_carterae.4